MIMNTRRSSRIAGSSQNQPTGSFQNQPTGSSQNQPTCSSQNQPTGSFQNQPTGSSQNQPTCSSQNQPTGSSQNQPRIRKRGISAVAMQDTQPDIPCSRKAKLEAIVAIEGQSLGILCAPQGNPSEGVKARVTGSASNNSKCTTTLKQLLSQNKTAIIATSHLKTYIQHNTAYEIQKASAISIMATAVTVWGCSILEAANKAAECTGYNAESVRKWALSFFSSSCSMSKDDITDEFITDELSSDRGHHDIRYSNLLLHNEEFQLAARTYVRSNSCIKGEPNLTSHMFANWIDSNYGIHISDSTALRRLNKLGFSQLRHQKGIFFDSHDRDDVVAYRNEFLAKLDELDKKSLTYDGTIPQLEEGEKPLIRVVHDESTYFANSHQTFFWGDDETSVLRQKSLGSSIMVSDFIDEVGGFLGDDIESARVSLEISKEGYFNNDHLLKQVEKTINIFERVYPHAKGIFLFDNAPSHCKVADDVPNADKMNAGPGGKQPVMRDTIWEGQVQKLVDDEGVPKGMKAILKERNIDITGMKVHELRENLKKFPDFANHKTLLEEYVEQRGHICLYYPKFHCELSPIERVWCQSKQYTRKHANGSIVRLRQIVPEGLDSVTVEQIKKYFRTCRDYERAYREGVTGKAVEEQVKVYKSHRRVTSTGTVTVTE